MNKVQSRRKASKAITAPETGTKERGWIVWALWVATYALGGTLGSLASSWVTDYFFPNHDAALGLSVPLPQLAVGILGTFVFGAVIGLANWLVLRIYTGGMSLWPVLTGLGLTAGSLVALMLLPLVITLPSDASNTRQVSMLSDSINSAIIGLLIGAAQALLLLRLNKNRASIATFILTSALGWLGLSLVASQLITLTDGLSNLGAIRQLAILIISFAVVGAISGIEVPSLVKKPQPEPAKENLLDDKPAAAGTD